jgi:hypothetical protein
MKVEMFTFCDFAQENGGKLTIVGTFDTIVAKAFPCVHPVMSLVIRLRFDIFEFGVHDFRIESRDLDGATVAEAISGKMEVKGVGNATAVTHLVFGIGNLQFKSNGDINFVLYLNEKEIAVTPLYLRKA